MPATSLPNFSNQDMALLINIARHAVKDHFNHVCEPPLLSLFSAPLRQLGACFVTLEVNEQLQGCLGSIDARIPLVEEVYHKAQSAAHEDRRFSPLKESQLAGLTIEVSVLSPVKTLKEPSLDAVLAYLDRERCGVVLTDHQRRAVFLPQVWEQLPTAKAFLSHLRLKGGWPENYWSDTMQTAVFTISSAKEAFQQD